MAIVEQQQRREAKTTTEKCTIIPKETTRKYNNSFINRTDLEESEPLQTLTETSTSTKTRSGIADHAHRNGKCINLIYFKN